LIELKNFKGQIGAFAEFKKEIKDTLEEKPK